MPAAFAQSQGVHVLDSAPKAHAQIGRRSSEFFVRFDRPVDHIKSRLIIKQGDRVIETLHPRLESGPGGAVRASAHPAAGRLHAHWAVVTLQGAQVVEGDIPFKVRTDRTMKALAQGVASSAHGAACGLRYIQETLRIRRPTKIVRKATAVPSAASVSRSTSTGCHGRPRLRLLMPMASGEKKSSATP